MDPQPDSDREVVWTIGRLLKWTSDYLIQQGIEEGRLATEVLLAHAAECRRIDLYARFEQPLDQGRLTRFREWVKRAADHEPIAYLVEEKEFFSMPLRVTRDVLIPRPETETLVEGAIDHCLRAGLAHPQLLDVGTGSGCIALALLAQIPGAKCVATDISTEALEVARINAERHGVLDRLTLVKADRLAIPGECVPQGGFDLVLSNPPYITAEGLAQLDVTVREYEPAMALTDGGDGLSFYRSLASDAPSLLTAGGVVIVEVGDDQAGAVIEEIEATASLVHRNSVKDRVVGQERVLFFSRIPGTCH